MCALTREVKPIGRLLRFVAGPDGQVVPDIRNRLPGRGIWLSLGRRVMGEAEKRKIYARGLKETVIVPENLADEVGRLLKSDAMQMLAFANKAGAVVNGFEKIASGGWPIIALVQARDGSEAERARLRGLTRGRGIKRDDPVVISAFYSQEIALSIGRESVIHAALKSHPVSLSFLDRAERMTEFEADGPAGDENRPASGFTAFPDASSVPDRSST